MDSRGVTWTARMSGPTRAGSLPEGRSRDELPEIFFLRFTREGDPRHEISLTLRSPDLSQEEAKELLEREPEWIYEDWAKP